MKWNDEQRADVARLWTVAGWSQGQIAWKYVTSRSTIASLINRMGLSGQGAETPAPIPTVKQMNAALRPRAAAAPTPKVSRPKRAVQQPTPELASAVPHDPAPASAVSLLDVADGGCKWVYDAPEGHSERFLYCGEPGTLSIRNGACYCERHRSLGIKKRRPSLDADLMRLARIAA